MRVDLVKGPSPLAARDGMSRVTSAVHSPDGRRLACATADSTVVQLVDPEAGRVGDRIPTRRAEGGSSTARDRPDSGRVGSGGTTGGGFGHAVTSLAFDGTSTRLAVGQSDGSLFVYRLGREWGARKSICNKFRGSSPVRCVAWAPSAALAGGGGGNAKRGGRVSSAGARNINSNSGGNGRNGKGNGGGDDDEHVHDEHDHDDDGGPELSTRGAVVVFGCEDGRVKLGNTLTNRSALLHDTGSPCMAACHDGGASVLTAHLDGSVYRFTLDTQGASRCKLIQCTGMPLCIAMGPLLQPGSGGPSAGLTASYVCAAVGPRLEFFSGGRTLGHTLPAGRPCGSLVLDPTGTVTAVSMCPSGTASFLAAGTFDTVWLVSPAAPGDDGIIDAVGGAGDLNADINNGGTVIPSSSSSSSSAPNQRALHGWKTMMRIPVPGLYTVSALDWHPLGSALAVGSLCGALEYLHAELGDSQMLHGRFAAITAAGKARLEVTDRPPRGTGNGTRPRSTVAHVESVQGKPITRFDVAGAGAHRFVLARTAESVVVSSFGTVGGVGGPPSRSCEIEWPPDCDPPRVLLGGYSAYPEPGPQWCLAWGSGACTLALMKPIDDPAPGVHPLLGSFPTDYPTRATVSIATASPSGALCAAYLLDRRTVRVSAFTHRQGGLSCEMAEVAVPRNDTGLIDWLSLSPSSAVLAFRTTSGSLYRARVIGTDTAVVPPFSNESNNSNNNNNNNTVAGGDEPGGSALPVPADRDAAPSRVADRVIAARWLESADVLVAETDDAGADQVVTAASGGTSETLLATCLAEQSEASAVAIRKMRDAVERVAAPLGSRGGGGARLGPIEAASITEAAIADCVARVAASGAATTTDDLFIAACEAVTAAAHSIADAADKKNAVHSSSRPDGGGGDHRRGTVWYEFHGGLSECRGYPAGPLGCDPLTLLSMVLVRRGHPDRSSLAIESLSGPLRAVFGSLSTTSSATTVTMAETDDLWRDVLNAALARGELKVAVRALAALGDVAGARFARRLAKAAEAEDDDALPQDNYHGGPGVGTFVKRAGIAVLFHAGRNGRNVDAATSDATALSPGVAESIQTLVSCGRADRAVELLATLGRHDEALSIAQRIGRDATSGPVHQAPAIQGAREYWEQHHGVDLADRARRLRESGAPLGEQFTAFMAAGAAGAAGKVIETALFQCGPRGSQSGNSGDANMWIDRARKVAEVLTGAGCPGQAARLLERTGTDADLARAARLYINALAFGDAMRCAGKVRDPTAKATVPSAESIHRMWAEHSASMCDFPDAERHFSDAGDAFHSTWAACKSGRVRECLSRVLADRGGVILNADTVGTRRGKELVSSLVRFAESTLDWAMVGIVWLSCGDISRCMRAVDRLPGRGSRLPDATDAVSMRLAELLATCQELSSPSSIADPSTATGATAGDAADGDNKDASQERRRGHAPWQDMAMARLASGNVRGCLDAIAQHGGADDGSTDGDDPRTKRLGLAMTEGTPPHATPREAREIAGVGCLLLGDVEGCVRAHSRAGEWTVAARAVDRWLGAGRGADAVCAFADAMGDLARASEARAAVGRPITPVPVPGGSPLRVAPAATPPSPEAHGSNASARSSGSTASSSPKGLEHGSRSDTTADIPFATGTPTASPSRASDHSGPDLRIPRALSLSSSSSPSPATGAASSSPHAKSQSPSPSPSPSHGNQATETTASTTTTAIGDAETKLDDGDQHGALDTLHANPGLTFGTVDRMDLVLAVAREVLAAGMTRTLVAAGESVMRSGAARTVLYHAATRDAPAAGMTLSPEFHRTLEALHLQDLSDRLAPREGLAEAEACHPLSRLGSLCTITLLRHCDLLAADRAFHDAGACASHLGWHGAALVFLLRFLDLAEGTPDDIDDHTGRSAGHIQTGDAGDAGADGNTADRLSSASTPGHADDNSGTDTGVGDGVGGGGGGVGGVVVDNAPFAETDIPSELSLPPHPSLSPAEVEAARGYVLLASMEEAGGGLPVVECAGCVAAGGEETNVYAAAARCPRCDTSWETCIATGMPLRGDVPTVRCDACGRMAEEAAWNVYWQAFGNCAWCRTSRGCSPAKNLK